MDVRATLLDQEAQLIRSLSLVRAKLNELALISCLPSEILESIFSICISRIYSSKRPKFSLSWTQVCRRWRQISLNSSRLWSCIDLSNPKFAQEFLLRSGRSPLSLVSLWTSKFCEDSPKLQSHVERLERVDLFLFPEDMQALFLSLQSNKLVNVRDLSLRIPSVCKPFASSVELPSVSRLCLESVAIPWTHCGSLTDLTLRGLGVEFSPTLVELGVLLDQSPFLKVVRLENIHPSHGDIDPPPVHLRYLEELIIAGVPHITSDILSLVLIPPTSKLRISYPYDLTSDLSSLFHATRNGTLWSDIEVMSTIANTIRIHRHVVHFTALEESRGSFADLDEDHWQSSMISVSSARIARTATSSLSSVINPTSIACLDLGTSALLEILPCTLEACLLSLHNLEHIHVAFNELTDLLSFLSRPPPATFVSSTIVCCPNLQRLSFGSSSSQARLWPRFYERWMQLIIRCLRLRYELVGVPLGLLDLHWCCGISPSCVEMQALKDELWVVEIGLIAKRGVSIEH